MYEKILVVDDEVSIVDILKYNLEKEGYRPIPAYDGYEAMQLFEKEMPALVILDVMMPGADGFQVCRKIRESSNVPIIMLTARAEEMDTVLGLEMGADDYMTKPFSMRELMARIRTSLRRYSALTQQGEGGNESFTAGELILDVDRFAIRKRGKTVDLTQRETELLKFFMSRRGQVFSRAAILERVWGYEALGDERTVDVTIRRLREKIEDEASAPEYILTKRGVGYYFNDKMR
ncbi:MAG: response regulator transcription factor [Lachnospiraceae bacterium]|jgi:two-component system response regulator VicR|nr:response regulator transcription factor [Lachnospiraceae bacterium]